DPLADASHAWSAGNGILHLAGKPVGFLKSEKTFSNYHLHAEWRWPAKTGNSGLLVHVHGANKVQPDALQCQIKDPHSGDLIGTAGFDFRPSTASHGNRFKEKMTAPSEKPPGQWNTYDVFCRGDTIEVFLNGLRQNEAHKLSTASGSIGLEVEGYPIDFRNVWLQPLPSQPK
ncbi:MAG: DUF1080 domain-containing protein, partial [Verrucomicrobiota bacterium]|nr:DUF1080 domain-containing protein [Verrucomicrobiota bacterium]